MKLLSIILVLLVGYPINAQWNQLITDIDDELNGIAVFDQNIMVSGTKGLYYSTDGGQNSNSWTRFEITDEEDIAAIYENTRFNHCLRNPELEGDNGTVYSCGFNVVTNRAVIFKVDLPSLNYELAYYGAENTVLNKLTYNEFHDYVAAVGNDGLMLRVLDSEIQTISLNNDDDYLSANFNGASLRLGVKDKILTGVLSSTSTSVNVGTVETYGMTHRAVLVHNSSLSYSAGDSYGRYHSSSGQTIYSNYDFGPLNGNTMLRYSDLHFIGTDHGIFRSNSSYDVLEWQPSSENHNIKDISLDLATEQLYACGNDGVILVSNSLGGSVKPYIKITAYGRCVGETVTIDYFDNLVNECVWSINGQHVPNNCSDLSYLFDSVGTYEISVTGTNGYPEQSTKSLTIEIVDPPVIDLPVTVLDTILCYTETLEIEIDDTDQNVKYILKKVGSSKSFGESAISSGGILSFTSIPIDEAGTYYLKAEHSLADCDEEFTDRFNIIIERTVADFTPELINAEVGEEITFSESSIDAQNYSWTFSAGAIPSVSDEANPSVVFSNLGATNAQLMVWSDAGCADTVQLEGPQIFEAPNDSPECWSIIYEGEDIYNGQYDSRQFPGFYDPEIMDLVPTANGFLTCGYFNKLTFDSRRGQSKFFDFNGSYLASHDYDGVLKWMVHTRKHASEDRDVQYSIAVDQVGDIYVAGYSRGTFNDNFGNTVNLGRDADPGFILKLSSRGELIWHMNLEKAYPKRLHIDQNNDLLVVGDLRTSSYSRPYFVNGEVRDTLTTIIANIQSNQFIAKFNSQADLIWDTSIMVPNSLGNTFVEAVKTDNSNQIYIMGYYRGSINFYSAGSIVETTLTPPPGSGTIRATYLTKFDQEGTIKWIMQHHTPNSGPNSTTGYDMDVDGAGNCYISGRNDAYWPTYFHTALNADGSTTQKSVGEFFISKVNSDGICEWINGGAHSRYGFGYQTLLLGNEICTIAGHIANNDDVPEEVTFVGNDSLSHTMTIEHSDYVLVYYDLNGNLSRIVTNGVNGAFFYRERFSGFFKGPGNSYYLSRNLGFFNGVNNYDNFGHNIEGTDGIDGVVSRITEECGITVYSNLVDADMDGFFSNVDCDDTNVDINPDSEEIAYDGLDNDCDSATLDDDLDEDGFLLIEDCDDTNADINPNSEEIPNNGIDEDCDGSDLIVATIESVPNAIYIYPNPVQNELSILQSNLPYAKFKVQLHDIAGQKLTQIVFNNSRVSIDMDKFRIGIYFLEVIDIDTGERIIRKIEKI